MNDPIVDEIRNNRERYAAKFNYDLTAICRDLRERQASLWARSRIPPSEEGREGAPGKR